MVKNTLIEQSLILIKQSVPKLNHLLGFLDEDSPVKLPFKSVSEHAIFKNFLGGMPPDPPSMQMVVLCMTYKPKHHVGS